MVLKDRHLPAARRLPTIALWTTGINCGWMGSQMPISRLLYVLLVMGKYGLTECQFPGWVDRLGKAASPASHMMVQPLMQRREATAWRL